MYPWWIGGPVPVYVAVAHGGLGPWHHAVFAGTVCCKDHPAFFDHLSMVMTCKLDLDFKPVVSKKEMESFCQAHRAQRLA
uniref:Uncharacterized protein n=1 Tax=Oryza punctata TaxID=4537 RepID=A0A0E0LLX1_ORYPU